MKDVLPIGSIVVVNNIDLMICSYFKPGTEIEGKKVDYACCLYPTGLGENAILVSRLEIQDVKFVGFQDTKFLKFKETMENLNG